MQLVERAPAVTGPATTVGPSIAVELSWALLAARSDELCASNPDLGALYGDAEGIAKAVRSFWSDGVADFAELLILADQAQVVSSVRIDELLAGIADAATRTGSAGFCPEDASRVAPLLDIYHWHDRVGRRQDGGLDGQLGIDAPDLDDRRREDTGG